MRIHSFSCTLYLNKRLFISNSPFLYCESFSLLLILFRAFGRWLDGGLIANNPTLDALTEIHEHSLALKAKGRDEEAAPVTVVVSLGTGLIPVKEVKEIDVFRPESIWDSAKLFIGISFLGNLLVDQVIRT